MEFVVNTKTRRLGSHVLPSRRVFASRATSQRGQFPMKCELLCNQLLSASINS